MKPELILAALAASGLLTACAGQTSSSAPTGAKPPISSISRTIENPQAIDIYALRESQWLPLEDMITDEVQIIRVASMYGLVLRSYVQIIKDESGVTLELSDAMNHRVTRPITDGQWDWLVVMDGLSREPFDADEVARHASRLSYCHGGDQIETYLNGRRYFIYPSECQGSATRYQQGFARAINSVALATFPECGSATEAPDLIRKLDHCPSIVLGTA